MVSPRQRLLFFKGVRSTVFYLLVITIALIIILPVFFIVSLSFLTTHEAYSYPLPLLPGVTSKFSLTHGERGYLLSVYDRVAGEYETVLDTDDLEKMSVYMKNRLGTTVSIEELEQQINRLSNEDPVYFSMRTDLLHTPTLVLIRLRKQ